MNIGHDEPFGLTRLGLMVPDRCFYAIIAKRRRAEDLEQRTDIMSLIMRARTEDGEALSDRELRDELMTLVLAGHETTANQLAWAWERLVRWPEAHERLREAVRSGSDDADEVVEATITEAMRVRPVIPMTGRRVAVPWRLGEYAIPADTRGRDQHPAAPSPRGPLSRARSRSGRSDGWGASPGPTSGSRSAAAPAAASARRWRWPSSGSCSRRWPAGSTCARPAPSRSGRSTAT